MYCIWTVLDLVECLVGYLLAESMVEGVTWCYEDRDGEWFPSQEDLSGLETQVKQTDYGIFATESECNAYVVEMIQAVILGGTVFSFAINLWFLFILYHGWKEMEHVTRTQTQARINNGLGMAGGPQYAT